jgi:hypothetical protein
LQEGVISEAALMLRSRRRWHRRRHTRQVHARVRAHGDRVHHAHQVRAEGRRHEVPRQLMRVGHEEVPAAGAEAGRAVVRVLPFVRCDHRRRVLVRPLHPLLHAALHRRAPVVAPVTTKKCTYLN